MAKNKIPSLCKQPDCIKLIFCYEEEFITDLTISTDLGLWSDSVTTLFGPRTEAGRVLMSFLTRVRRREKISCVRVNPTTHQSMVEAGLPPAGTAVRSSLRQ